MALAWLCQIDAFARDDGAASPIRLASHDDDRLCHLNALTWWPAIARLPTLTYDFFDGAFGGEIVTPSGRAELSIAGVPDFAALMLHGARIRWWSGELGAAWGSFTLRFDGMIDNHPAVRDGAASVEFRVDDRWLDDPILSTYAGTTGAEGEAAQKGQVKPLMLGAPRMVEGVLIDSIDTINQLSDGPIEGVEVAMEDAARFAAPVADYASFAALDGATIAPGFVATGLAVGLVRHGAPGDGVLTYDVKGSNSGADGGGWVRRAGAIVKRLAARQDKLAKVDTAALTALDTARPWNISIALTSQTTMRELVQSIAQSINAVALVTWTGLLTILPVDPPEGATPVGTLASDGSALPPVARVDQLGIAAPWWRVAIEAEVTQRVHGADEIRFTAALVDRGRYDAAESYREGHIVDMADGSRWLYVAVTPTTGNAPPTWPVTSNAFWTMLSPPSAAPTDRSPTPPLELNEGTIWIAPDGHPYRFGRRPWVGADGNAWIGADGEPWLGSGYEDVQDQLGVQAMAAAEAVTAEVARIASDGWLTAGEKSGLVLSHKAMIENHIALDAKAAALGVAATERTNATNAVNALNAYLTSLSPAWNDTTQDSEADAATITGLWGDAAQKVALLQAAVQGLPGPQGDPGTNGIDGIDGDDGKLVEFVWKRAASQPAAPTGNGIPSGWSDDPPAGSDPLWMSKAKQELDGTLVAGESWSTPIRHDGAAALDLAAAPASVVVPCNSIGVPNSGVLPITVQLTARLGASDVTGTVTWPAASVTNCQVTSLGGGAYRIDDITAEAGSFEVAITHGGQSTARRVTLAKARAGADAQRAQTGGFGTPGASWGVASGSTITLNVFPSTTITLSMSASYDAANAGSCRVLARLMYRNITDSGSWTQAGSDITGSYANNTGGTEPELTPGSAGGSANVTAPTAAKSYEFRLEWVKDGFATIDMSESTFAVSIT